VRQGPPVPPDPMAVSLLCGNWWMRSKKVGCSQILFNLWVIMLSKHLYKVNKCRYIQYRTRERGSGVLPNPEPNGVFSSAERAFEPASEPNQTISTFDFRPKWVDGGVGWSISFSKHRHLLIWYVKRLCNIDSSIGQVSAKVTFSVKNSSVTSQHPDSPSLYRLISGRWVTRKKQEKKTPLAWASQYRLRN